MTLYLLFGTNLAYGGHSGFHIDGDKERQGRGDERSDPRRGRSPDSSPGLSLHLARRCPPRERRGQGQLLLLLQEQGRAGVRRHRPAGAWLRRADRKSVV